MKTTFTILTVLPFFAYAQSPGGVSTNLSLWNKANAGVTTSGSNVTGWTDQTAVNTFTVTGTPTLDASKYNYNPAIVFDGSSRFTGNTSITNMTHAIVVGYMENGIGTTASGAMMGISTTINRYFFHTEGLPRHFTCNDGSAAVDATLPSNSIQFSIVSEDLAKTPAANDMIRRNGTDLPNVGGDPAPFNGIPTLGSRGTENIRNTSALVECILYNASLSATDLNKVESYLAVKYGITLGTNYVNAGGATVYNVSTYGSNIIGIARDDNSALSQKQSHQSDDATRIYLSTLAANNIANAGSFSSDAQFVMMGNNNATLANNTGNTEYPASVGIVNRINREWKITNTGFTGSFSIDITPSAGTYDAKKLRLLVDDDGDFSNGGTTVYPASISYSGGVISVHNITTALIPAGNTRYITLATVASPGGVSSNNLHLWLRADAGVVTSGANVSQWTNQSPVSMTLQASKTASSNVTLDVDDFNYNPTLVFDGASSQVLSGTFSALPSNAAMLFAVTKKASSPSIFLANPYSLGPAGASGIAYNNSNAYAVDRAGGTCASTADVRNLPSVVRVDYSAATSSNGATTALNGLVTAAACPANTVSTADGSFQVGGRTFGSQPTRVFSGQIAEVIHFDSDNLPSTVADINKVESYLAVKYGLTLDNSASGTLGGNYTSSGGSTIWDAAVNSTYHNQIIGIGRDDETALLQKQSHTADDTTRIYLSSLQTSNAGNSGSFASNESFVMAGHNGGEMFSTGSTEYPTGQGIYARLDREWKITNTSFSGTFSMDFKPRFTNVTASDLRVLIDADGDFSNATMYSPTIAYNSGVITVTGINNTMVPSGSTRYLTLVSLAPTTPLPVLLTSFTAQPKDETVQLEWTTASEQNNAWFVVERSADREHWQQIGKVAGAGNSSQTLHYSYTDVQPLNGISYYRLKQTDADGAFKYSPLETVRRQATETSLRLYPNPVSNEVIVKGNRTDLQTLKVFDLLGRDVTQKLRMRNDGASIIVNMAGMPGGLYIFKIRNNSYEVLKR